MELSLGIETVGAALRAALAINLAVASVVSATTVAAQDEGQIRRARAESNQSIARHDVPGIVAFLADEYQASVSNGNFVKSPGEMGTIFAAHFAEFKDAIYVRTPDSVVVSSSGQTASETGNWTGSWTKPGGPFRIGGRYAAYWRKVAGKWLIHSELFVPLFCNGPGCS
jgi:ketosteroid isomerase-like protein